MDLKHESDAAVTDQARNRAAFDAAVKAFAVRVVEPGTTCR